MSMTGINGIEFPIQLASYINLPLIFNDNFILNIAQWDNGVPFILIVVLGTYLIPNTFQLMRKTKPVLENDLTPKDASYSLPIHWKQNKTWVILLSVCAGLSLMGMDRVSEFLYFQF